MLRRPMLPWPFEPERETLMTVKGQISDRKKRRPMSPGAEAGRSFKQTCLQLQRSAQP